MLREVVERERRRRRRRDVRNVREETLKERKTEKKKGKKKSRNKEIQGDKWYSRRKRRYYIEYFTTYAIYKWW